MDYQFIHSVVREQYVDLPVVSPVPGEYLAELRKYAGVCDCLNNIGECFGYFALRPERGASLLFFSRTARKRNAVSVAKYTQSAAWKQSGTLLLEQMDEILAYPFFSEEQIDEFADSGARIRGSGNQSSAGSERPAVAREAIRAILYGAMRRWLQGEDQIHIAVPEDKMSAYNQYVLSAAGLIYSYFPVNMRGKTGFSSYLSAEHERSFPGFSIIFVPSSMADEKAIMLDGSSPGAYQRMIKSTGLLALDRLLDYLAQLDEPVKRGEFIGAIYEDVEKSADISGAVFDPMSYAAMGDGLIMLEAKGESGQLIPQWLRFAADKERYPAGMRGEIDKRISELLKPQDIQAYAAQKLQAGASLRALAEAVKLLEPLCRDRDACREGLWVFLNEAAERSGERTDAIYRAYGDNRRLWSTLTNNAAFEAKREELGLRVALELKERAKTQLEKLGQAQTGLKTLKRDTDMLLAAFEKNAGEYSGGPGLEALKGELAAYQRQLIAQQIKAELETERQSMPRTQSDIEAEFKKLQALAGFLPEDKTEAEKAIYAQMQERVEELNLQYNASATLYCQLEGEIDSAGDYFAALEKAAGKTEGLSEEDLERIKQKLWQRRPGWRKEYLSLFENHYNTPFSMAAIEDKPAFLRRWIIADMASGYAGVQALDLQGKTSSSLIRQLHGLEAEARMFGVQSLRVEIDGYRTEAALLEQVASPGESGRAGQLTEQSFSQISQRLLRAGVYSAGQLKALLEMASRFGSDIKPIFSETLGGAVRGMDEGDYDAFFAAVRKTLGELKIAGDRRAADKWILSSAAAVERKTGEAQKSLKKIEKTMKGPEKEGRDDKGRDDKGRDDKGRDDKGRDDKGQKNKGQEGKHRGKDPKKPKQKLNWVIIGAVAALLLVMLALAIMLLNPRTTETAPTPPAETAAGSDLAVMMESAYQSALQQEGGSFQLANMGLGNAELEKLASYYTLHLPEDEELFSRLMEEKEFLRQAGYPTELDLSGNNISELSSLSALKGLRRLYLDNNSGIVELSGLTELSGLELLSLKGINVSQEQIQQISQANPGCLVLWTLDGEDMATLAGSNYTKGQTEWDLSGRGLSEIAAIAEAEELFAQLKALDLSFNPIESLQGLEAMKGLEYLELTGAALGDGTLAELAALESLKLLNIADNPSISPQAVIELGERLGEGCRIVYTESRQEYIEIKGELYPADARELDLSGRDLGDEDISGLSEFRNLRRLDLSGNRIETLEILTQMENMALLEWLDISDNQLSDLTALAGQSSLAVVYADRNPLTSIGFRDSSNMRSLKLLSLTGIDTITNYSGLRNLEALEALNLKDAAAEADAKLSEALNELENLKLLRLGSRALLQTWALEELEQRCCILPLPPAAAEQGAG